MPLEDVHYGRIITHLSELARSLGSACGGGPDAGAHVRQAIARIVASPVYKRIEAAEHSPTAGRFRLPVQDCRRIGQLRDALAELGDANRWPDDSSRDFADKFVTLMTHWLSQYGGPWGMDGYFIIPVMALAGWQRQPGMVYLTCKPLPIGHPPTRPHIADLTRDPGLLECGEDYFGQIIVAMLKALYMVETYPFDHYAGLMQHSYGLHFGCQITEGKSMGAAVLAMFAIAFLHNTLGAEAARVIAPRCGTVITGDVGPDGAIGPVDYFKEKIVCVHEEYGPGVKLVAPRDQDIPKDIRFDQGNVHHVGTTEELLAAVLGSNGDRRGLDAARAALFRKLTEPQKAELKKFVRQGIDPGVYDRMAAGQDVSLTPKNQGAVYVISKAWQDRLEVRISLEPAGLQDPRDAGHPQEEELLVVIVDGSSLMDEAWTLKDGICRITSVLFEIAGKIREKQELICGFLSHSAFIPIRRGEAAESIGSRIHRIRRESHLKARGSYFRAVREQCMKKYESRLKRIYVISDSYIPDLEDHRLMNVSSLVRFYLHDRPDSVDEYDEEEQRVLFPDGNLNESLLRKYFHKTDGKIRTVRIGFGESLPFVWSLADLALTKREDSLCLEPPQKLDADNAVVHIRTQSQHPATIRISGQVVRDGEPQAFDFVEQPVVAEVDFDFGTLCQHGQLNDDEYSLWQKVTSSGGDIDLYCDDSSIIRRQVAFGSLRSLRDGHFLFKKDSRDWHFFQTGCQRDGITFVVVDGALCYSAARGHLEEVPYDKTVLHLRHEGQDYYLCSI